MALVRCPDCDQEISDAAPACPKCGRPKTTASAPVVVQTQGREARLWGTITVFVGVAVCIEWPVLGAAIVGLGFVIFVIGRAMD